LSRKILVRSMWLSLGVACALLLISVLVAKMFLWVMMWHLAPILIDFLERVTNDSSYGLIQTFIGIML
jgi:hypothetical protein